MTLGTWHMSVIPTLGYTVRPCLGKRTKVREGEERKLGKKMKSNRMEEKIMEDEGAGKGRLACEILKTCKD